MSGAGAVSAAALAGAGSWASTLRSAGSTVPWRDRMLDFDGLNELIGTPQLLAEGRRYD